MLDLTRMVCGNCRFCGTSEAKEPQCEHDPPQVIGAAVVQKAVIPGGPPKLEWMAQSVRPPVKADWRACSKFEPRPEAVN